MKNFYLENCDPALFAAQAGQSRRPQVGRRIPHGIRLHPPTLEVILVQHGVGVRAPLLPLVGVRQSDQRGR
jgi:hypothetical protein